MAALAQLWEPDPQQDKAAIDPAEFRGVPESPGSNSLFNSALFFFWRGGMAR